MSVEQKETPVVEQEVVADAPAQVESEEQPVSDAPAPEWTPNYKVKVLGEEKEIDDWVKPLVNKDNEAKFKELYEMKYGLPHIKEKGMQAEQKYNQIISELQQLKELQDVDFEGFLNGIGISPDRIYQYVLEKLQLQEMSPEQRAEKQRFAEAQRKSYTTEKEYKSLEQQYNAQLAQMREVQVDTALMRPEISQVAESYNSRRGNPSAFKDLVYMVGQHHFNSTGKDIPVEQAIKEAQALVGMDTPQATPAPVPVAPAKKPTLPTVGGGSASPVDKQPRSVADIEEYYNKKYGRK